jgi:hypothetical protein
MPENQYIYVTYFDSKYVVRGLTMIESVNAYKELRKVKWVVLALDEESYQSASEFLTAEDDLIRIEQFDDSELLTLRESRPYREFCWTIAACLINYAIKSTGFGGIVTYVDSDCYFFSNPFNFLENELKSHDIVIHPHDFSINREAQEKAFGKFNVGVIAGVVSKDYRECVSEWRDQVILKCEINEVAGIFGDQKYLDDWPVKFDSVAVVTNPGYGRAPWNIGQSEVLLTNNGLRIDSHELIFYHFHGFRIFHVWYKLYFCVPALGYRFGDKILASIYQIYATKLVQNRSRLQNDVILTQGFTLSYSTILTLIRSSKLLLKVRKESVE